MRINFRQGIISAQNEFGGFLKVNPTTVDLLTDNRQLTLTVAQSLHNYTHVETASVGGAWTVGSSSPGSFWLYWDFHKATFIRTFGITTVAPVSQNIAPSDPVADQHWFDTINNRQMVFVGVWTEVLRVFAGRLTDGEMFSMSNNAPSFYGTQIGNVSSIRTGRVIFDESNESIRRDDGTFITTEDQLFASGSRVDGIRLESNVDYAKFLGPGMACNAFTVVAYDSALPGVNVAKYDDPGNTILGVLTEDLTVGEVGTVVLQGVVTNSAWNWPLADPAAPVGSALWVLNGNLVAEDPHVTSNVTYPNGPNVPVARVLARDQVIFEQGLGGVGPRGATGTIEDLPIAQQVSDFIDPTTALGAVVISEHGGAVIQNPALPAVIHENDPIVLSWDELTFGLEGFSKPGHSHDAEFLTYSAIGTSPTITIEEALLNLDALKLDLNGSNSPMTGPLTLSGNPTNTFHAATKNYVDGLVIGLIWQDPIDGYVNLISNTTTTPPASPAISDVYVVPTGATGVWAGPSLVNHVVIATGGSPVWRDEGSLLSDFAVGTRFGVSMESTTPPVGRDKGHIYALTDNTGAGTFTDSDDTNVDAVAVFVSNEKSLHAYHQYVWDLPTTTWTEFGGGMAITPGDNILVVGNIWNVQDWSVGGTIDASTIKGLDFGYSSTLGADWGTPINDPQLNSTDVHSALDELQDERAQRAPEYATLGDLPIAANVTGMVAYVTDEQRIYHAGGSPVTWIPMMNQNDSFYMPYDLMFYFGGAMTATNSVVGTFIAPRTIEIKANFPGSLAESDTAATAETIYDIQYKPSAGSFSSVGTLTFGAGSKVGVFDSIGSPGTGISMGIGDILKMVTQSGTVDATIADVAVSIIACALTTASDTCA